MTDADDRRDRRSLAVVIVHYHGPELVQRAWSALREDAERAELELELEGVVVDNGSTADEARLLAELERSDSGLKLIEAGTNLGYAGGANLGLRQTRSELALLSNPDVRVLPGCLLALVDALDAGASVAGPTFFWDRPGGFRLPPTEERNRLAELGRLLAWHPAWEPRARRRWRAHAREQWLAEQVHEYGDLSGALLVFRRSAWERHPFDEGFPLYYEETDWLRRLRAAGEKLVHVPAAMALHAYAQSTRSEPKAQEWFRVSEHRFRRRHYGRAFTWALEKLADRWSARRSGGGPGGDISAGDESLPAIEGPGPLPGPLPAGEDRITWLELSPSSAGFPCAGRIVDEGEVALLSEELWAILEPGTYFLRALDARDRTIGLWRVVRRG